MHIKPILIFFLGISTIGLSQTEKIAEWQRIHPNVIFIEKNDFTPEFEEKLSALNQEFILYQGEISINEINSYETKAYEKSTAGQIRQDGGNQEIKDWLGQNQTIKIVPRSYYDSTTNDERDLLLSINALILAGEKLTITDIYNYESIH
jgi:hypothetical protein